MLSSPTSFRYQIMMRKLVPLIVLLLAACNADKPAAPPVETDSASQSDDVAAKANADVEAALAEAR